MRCLLFGAWHCTSFGVINIRNVEPNKIAAATLLPDRINHIRMLERYTKCVLQSQFYVLEYNVI